MTSIWMMRWVMIAITTIMMVYTLTQHIYTLVVHTLVACHVSTF
jgi:hypothetical protein